VGRGGRGIAGSNRGRRLKPRSSDSSDVNMERLATIASENTGKAESDKATGGLQY
jgi:hypothetical protein